MIHINILDNYQKDLFHRFPPYWTHWYPLCFNRLHLKELGLNFKFFNKIVDGLYDCDVLFLSSRYFHIEGKDVDGKKGILETLSEIKEKVRKNIWFDQRDSSGNTQFEVLPFVSAYLKKQLLKDKELYRKKLYGNRIYTDYYHKKFGVEDTYDEEQAPLPESEEKKLGISWNLGQLDNRGGSYPERIFYNLGDFFEKNIGLGFFMPWQSYSNKRSISLAAFFNLNYKRKTIAFQRERAMGILKSIQDNGIFYGKKLPRRQYFKILRKAKIVLSLFGWGEINYRDFETFIAGAALMMPDLSHLETWPELHIPYETYLPVKWDLSDLEESYKRLLKDDKLRKSIAQSGQDRYRWQWSREGRFNFCERLKSIVINCYKG